MPYTISFDESAKIVPQIRSIIGSFPEVTTVSSEHGRPDDGTDATGFFNSEFYVGLKPYSQWRGPIFDLYFQGRLQVDQGDQARGAGEHGRRHRPFRLGRDISLTGDGLLAQDDAHRRQLYAQVLQKIGLAQ